MDRRSWPWRKKTSERSAAPVLAEPGNPGPVNHTSKLLDELDFSNFLLSDEKKMDDGTGRRQYDEKLQILADKLSVALSENTAKDDLVKQHSKVAEEAVSGWEKAEAEAANLKLKLDDLVQQKLDMENRLSQGDGALKECMRQLRKVCEEQEQRIQDAILTNKGESDKVREELEAKLAEVDRRLLESKAENDALSRILQERTATVSVLNSSKTQAETRIGVLQIRLDASEKEKSSLRYEIQVLSKELEIRNEERRYSKRDAEISNKQRLEDVKKLTKLEAECQKLRGLVRRKLPGPAALAQMKIEAESLGMEMEPPFRRRTSLKHPGSYGSSPRHGNRDIEILTQRMSAMEEDSRMLREALAQRNQELQAARLLCARTANKLSTMESQFDAVSQTSGLSGSRQLGADMQASRSRDVNGCISSTLSLSGESVPDDEAGSEAWASALVSELAHLKNEKPVAISENLLDSMKLNLMDDFSDMEHFVSATAGEDLHGNEESGKDKTDSSDHNGDEIKECVSLGELAQKDKEIEDANLMCIELKDKLVAAEQQICELRSKNNGNEAALVDIQDKLNGIFEAQSEGDDTTDILEKVKSAMASPTISSLLTKTADYSASNGTAWKAIQRPNVIKSLKWEDANAIYHIIFLRLNRDTTAALGTDSKEMAYELSLELVANLRKFTELLQMLAKPFGVTCGGDELQPEYEEDHTRSDPYTKNSLENLPLENRIRTMATLSNKFLDGRSKFEELIQELFSVLQANTKLPLTPNGVYQSMTSDCRDPSMESTKNDRDEVVLSSEYILKGNFQIDEADGVNVKDTDDILPEKSLNESPEAGSNRFASLEKELIKLKLENADSERRLEAALQKTESIATQLLRADQLATELQHKLDSCELSKRLMEEQLLAMASSREVLESDLKSANALIASLEERVRFLQGELEAECLNRQAACVKVQDLQPQIDSMEGCAQRLPVGAPDSEYHHHTAELEAKARQENEIAAASEKLAECQRTILVLGQQLKAMTSPKQSSDTSFSSKPKSSSSSSAVDKTRNPELHYEGNSEDVQSEIDVSGPSLDSGGSKNSPKDFRLTAKGDDGSKSSPKDVWLTAKGDDGFDQQSPWSPPGYATSSPYAPRGPVTRPFELEKMNERKLDPETQKSNGFHSPNRNEHVEPQSPAPLSPDNAFISCSGGKSPARFLAMKKRSSSNDLFAARGRPPPEKSGSSAFTRLFSRTKTQWT